VKLLQEKVENTMEHLDMSNDILSRTPKHLDEINNQNIQGTQKNQVSKE
jgi:hypothetical protein